MQMRVREAAQRPAFGLRADRRIDADLTFEIS